MASVRTTQAIVTDTLSQAERSERMSRIRGKGTKPELAVRRIVRRLGVRYQQHLKRLPGRPDLVIAAQRKVIFVHGCFWHCHRGCDQWRVPKSRTTFWKSKLRANQLRDLRNRRDIKRLGWECLVVWECEVRQESKLERRLRKYLR
jgi:DNA mismatch endonuclease, patch repair protein